MRCPKIQKGLCCFKDFCTTISDDQFVKCADGETSTANGACETIAKWSAAVITQTGTSARCNDYTVAGGKLFSEASGVFIKQRPGSRGVN